MYNYSLVETNGAGRVVIPGNTTDTKLSVEQNVTVTPFTNYTATVVGFTSAGEGESVMEVVLSPEVGKFISWWYVVLNMVVVMLLSVHYLHSTWPSAKCRIDVFGIS